MTTRSKRLATVITANSGPSLMTEKDWEIFCEMQDVKRGKEATEKRKVINNLRYLADIMIGGTKAFRGHGYTFRPTDDALTSWEASDGDIFSVSSLLGLIIHALGMESDIILSPHAEKLHDYIIPSHQAGTYQAEKPFTLNRKLPEQWVKP